MDCLKGSVLGLFLFLIYNNDLLNGVKSIFKVFADDTSLFPKVKNKTCFDVPLSNDLNKINKCPFQ